eukprot:TRINITY_DN6725_c0_g1_i1.p1 TRINITY_DN6725_c0_g1~~TRINITY_DN6725_c0_g1_i1.p1  ORF type:complete len:267 (+),score=51.13 TRINITY_DN6725_c0_g1_i1:61-861(+)
MLVTEPKPPDGRPGHQRSSQKAVADAEAQLGKWAKVARSRFVGRIVLQDRPALAGVPIKEKQVDIAAPNVGGILGSFEQSALGLLNPSSKVASIKQQSHCRAAAAAACTVVAITVAASKWAFEEVLICRGPRISFPQIVSSMPSIVAAVITVLSCSVSTRSIQSEVVGTQRPARRLVETAVVNPVLSLPGRSSFLLELTGEELDPPPPPKPKTIKKKVRLNTLPTVTWQVAEEVGADNTQMATSAVVQIDPLWSKHGTPHLAKPAT